MKTRLFTFLLVVIAYCGYGQDSKGKRPNFYAKSSSMQLIPSLNAKKQLIPAKNITGEIKDGRSSKNKIIIGKGSKGDDILAKNPNRLSQKIQGKIPELTFDAVTGLGSSPTDPSLAIGPNHVFVVFNTGFKIFDKQGNDLTGNLAVENIFSPGGCCDLTVSYDNAADRWVVSYLFFDGSVQVAVSRGRNPVTSEWAVYTYQDIDDYQKLSVWSDGYYLTANVGFNPAADNAVFALEREAMLAGAPSAQIIGFPLPGVATEGFYSPQAFNVSNKDLPAVGNAPIVYLQDDAFQGIDEDHLKIWTINADFTNPASSSISQPTELITTPFVGVFDQGAFNNLPQPNGGGDIDALQATIMNQAQFRKFDTHNSAVFTFVVDVDGSTDGKLAGIRWYELRQDGDGQPWSIYQEGTYTSPDGKNAWCGTMMMDDLGNIAMGYTGMGGTNDLFASSYYTGRFANDALNTMTISETLIAEGQGNFPNERYGDYNKIDVDPNTDRKFWFINEYVGATDNPGARSNVVGVFQIAPDRTDDIGIVDIDISEEGSFTVDEDVKITVFNFGQNSVSNFDVTYQIDNGTVVTETFTGIIESNMSADFTFVQTADLSEEGRTYTITSSASLVGDEFLNNNTREQTIKHLFANDVGITEIIAPNTGENAGNQDVIVRINNFGIAEQSNFDVSYTINGGTPVVETFVGPLASQSNEEYTFTTTADVSNLGPYQIESTTLLGTDTNAGNDQTDKTFSTVEIRCENQINETSQPISDTDQPADAFTSILIADDFIVTDVNVTVNVEHGNVGDFLVALFAPDGTAVVLADFLGISGANLTDTNFDDEASTGILTGSPPFTGSFIPQNPLSVFDGLSSAGEWTLLVRDFDTPVGGQLLDWSIEVCGFNDPVLAIGEDFEERSELMILDRGEDQFEINLATTEMKDMLEMNIYNMQGKRLLYHRLKNEDGQYSYDLDMSYAPSGIYLVKLNDGKNRSKIKRFIVR